MRNELGVGVGTSESVHAELNLDQRVSNWFEQHAPWITEQYRTKDYALVGYFSVLVRRYFPNQSDYALIDDCTEFVLDLMKDDKRDSGVPVVLHSVENTLARMGAVPQAALRKIETWEDFCEVAEFRTDEQVISLRGRVSVNEVRAELLHDVIEDYDYKTEEKKQVLRTRFGSDVVDVLMDGLTAIKSDVIAKMPAEEQSASITFRLVRTLGEDLRIMGLKVWDLFSNVFSLDDLKAKYHEDGTLKESSESRINRKAKEYFNYARILLELRIPEAHALLDELFRRVMPVEHFEHVVLRNAYSENYRNARECVLDHFIPQMKDYLERKNLGEGFLYKYEEPGVYQAYVRQHEYGVSQAVAYAPAVYLRVADSTVYKEMFDFIRHFSFDQRLYDEQSKMSMTPDCNADRTEILIPMMSGLPIRLVLYEPEHEWMYMDFWEMVREDRTPQAQVAMEQLMFRYRQYFAQLNTQMRAVEMMDIVRRQAGRFLMPINVLLESGEQIGVRLERGASIVDLVARLGRIYEIADGAIGASYLLNPECEVRRLGPHETLFDDKTIFVRSGGSEYCDAGLLGPHTYAACRTPEGRALLLAVARRLLERGELSSDDEVELMSIFDAASFVES